MKTRLERANNRDISVRQEVDDGKAITVQLLLVKESDKTDDYTYY